jgi:predicted AAA+ superfamily ATPase
MQKRFINFLKNTGVTLTKPQMELAKLIIKSSEENKVIASLLYGGRRTGKTTLFSLLEEFFSTVEVANRPNLINPYLDGATTQLNRYAKRV